MFNKDQNTFMVISRSFLLGMRKVSEKNLYLSFRASQVYNI